ncbi:MAG TPA: hypothetical protein VF841_14150 [Anaeromyxobacter sp.]
MSVLVVFSIACLVLYEVATTSRPRSPWNAGSQSRHRRAAASPVLMPVRSSSAYSMRRSAGTLGSARSRPTCSAVSPPSRVRETVTLRGRSPRVHTHGLTATRSRFAASRNSARHVAATFRTLAGAIRSP